MSAEFDVEGMRELDAAFARLGDPAKIRRASYGMMRYALEPVLHAARSNIPVDTGVTVSEIQIRSERREDMPTVSVGLSSGKKNRVFIGRFVERGTAHTPARPWLRPAFDENIQQVLSRLKTKAAAFIKRINKRYGDW